MYQVERRRASQPDQNEASEREGRSEERSDSDLRKLGGVQSADSIEEINHAATLVKASRKRYTKGPKKQECCVRGEAISALARAKEKGEFCIRVRGGGHSAVGKQLHFRH
jgi:hypothetical protein